MGILAAIAIPNYRTYQVRARQSEAKVALSRVFVAEKAFASDVKTYSSCLTGLGVDNVGNSGQNRYYSYGFGESISANTNCGPVTQNKACDGYAFDRTGTPTLNCGATNTRACSEWKVCFPANIPDNGASISATNGNLYNSFISAYVFTAKAAGKNRSDNTTMDIWRINDQQILVNEQVAL